MEKIKVKIDIVKARIDGIHKKLLIFLGVGAGSWIYGLEFGDSENIMSLMFAVLFFIVFAFAGLGSVISLFKLSQLDKKLIQLEKEIENVE